MIYRYHLFSSRFFNLIRFPFFFQFSDNKICYNYNNRLHFISFMRLNILWLNASKPNDLKTQLLGTSKLCCECVCVCLKLLNWLCMTTNISSPNGKMKKKNEKQKKQKYLMHSIMVAHLIPRYYHALNCIGMLSCSNNNTCYLLPNMKLSCFLIILYFPNPI